MTAVFCSNSAFKAAISCSRLCSYAHTCTTYTNVWIDSHRKSIQSSWCHCHPIISCCCKIQNGLPFWCRLTQVVLEKRPLNRCSSSSSSIHPIITVKLACIAKFSPLPAYWHKLLQYWTYNHTLHSSTELRYGHTSLSNEYSKAPFSYQATGWSTSFNFLWIESCLQ